MLLEAQRSARNERALRAAGAIEPSHDVYALMQVTYPASFLAMIAEAWMRGSGLTALAVVGAVVFVLAKTIKYWAIATLGDRWTFRVLVPPGSARTLHGPYRWLRHPNYVGVAGEMVGFALLAQSPITGMIATGLFALLLVARIRVEERALGLRSG
jgi:methyltransferase